MNIGRLKCFWHQRMAIIIPFKLKGLILIEVIENVMQSFKKLLHLVRPMMPWHSEAPGYMRFDLGTQTQNKPSATERIEIMRQLRCAHRISGERDCD